MSEVGGVGYGGSDIHRSYLGFVHTSRYHH